MRMLQGSDTLKQRGNFHVAPPAGKQRRKMGRPILPSFKTVVSFSKSGLINW